jgi:hypothetical protein
MTADRDDEVGRLPAVRAVLTERTGLHLATTENGKWVHVVDFDAENARVSVRPDLRGVPLCMTYGNYRPLDADPSDVADRLCGKCVAELLDLTAAPVESTSDLGEE